MTLYNYQNQPTEGKAQIPKDWQSMINRLESRTREGSDMPPLNWKHFLADTAQVFVEKDTDYNSRYMRALIELDAPTIWRWEVDKKLDRIRTWIKRGELQVKGEGLNNAVQDLFNYTVQYALYVEFVELQGRPGKEFLKELQATRFRLFYDAARMNSTEYWLDFLIRKERIKEDELLLINMVSWYMGRKPTVEEWKEATRQMIGKHIDERV